MKTLIYRYAHDAEHGRDNVPKKTRRPPGNVPYLIDNLWEWLRPSSMPNRRHSVFASPTPQLAMVAAGASPGSDTGVGSVVMLGSATLAQVSVPDARDHPDVRALRNTVLGFLGVGWQQSPLANKESLGRLFIPLLSREEVEAVLREAPALAESLRAASTFWTDAVPVRLDAPLPYADGEIFFEAADGYRLERLRV